MGSGRETYPREKEMIELFFDIETIPDQSDGAIEKYIALVKPPGQYKKQESIDAWMEENAAAAAVENWKKSALHGIGGQICSISWTFGDDEPVGVVGDERDVILTFFLAIEEQVHAGEGAFPTIRWIGHNILGFDLRFLFQRCVIRDIAPPVHLPMDARQGSDKVYDTMEAWAGWKGYVKQDALLEALGIDMGADEDVAGVDGSMVWDLYQSGQLERILKYNKLDVAKARALYRRMTWQP